MLYAVQLFSGFICSDYQGIPISGYFKFQLRLKILNTYMDEGNVVSIYSEYWPKSLITSLFY